jgi:hypothetical protein
MICAEQKKRLFEEFLDTNGNENRLETTDVRRGMERRESFTLDRGNRRADGGLSYVKLGNCVIIGKNSGIYLQRLNPSKASTVWELLRALSCDLGALRTIRPMLLSMHVMMSGRRRGHPLMVMIGVFLANARTVRFTRGSHCRVGAEQRHCKNNRR